jgi:hemoglobin
MTGSATPIPLIEPVRGVTEDMIRRLVETFYDRVLQDDELGPIFRRALSHRWDEHLAIMVDFWSSIALRTGRYEGKPQQAHRGMALVEGHFERWLALFEATAREVCGHNIAEFFIDRARRIADSLQIGLNIGPKALILPSRDASGDDVRG